MAKYNGPGKYNDPGVFVDEDAKPPTRLVPERILVKVQAPIVPADADLYIYDEHRGVTLMTGDPAVRHRMGASLKKYFYARLTRTWDDKQTLHLDEEAPEQSW